MEINFDEVKGRLSESVIAKKNKPILKEIGKLLAISSDDATNKKVGKGIDFD